MPVIELKNLSKTYYRDFLDIEHGRLKLRIRDRKYEALKGLTMNVERGEIFGLLGPNGAGKTTTIKILMGIHFATGGSARIFGAPLGDRAVKRRIGFLPENPYFYDYLTGREFLNFYGQLYGIPKSKRGKKIEEMLELVGLSHAGGIPLRGYSKGMNQRIGLAQTMLNDPDLVFLDEPQSGLDPLGRKDVRDLILSLREMGKTVFFSSHILSDAELICDRVAILVRGELRAIGSMSKLLSQKVSEWELVVEGVSPEKLDAWRPSCNKMVVQEGKALILVREEKLADEIVHTTVTGGGKLVRLTPHKQSLEDYFLEEVGKAPGAKPPTPPPDAEPAPGATASTGGDRA